ncbi:hypothetical protein [Ilumatobacter nonamiensis]|uniref:hypothetical protein n=1 Tax=Ilumatobacter nonamiensis TaxID=467093 RepID=UPI00058DF21C|nr:hypothetical protein [Ilumatobacter nonamiensis]
MDDGDRIDPDAARSSAEVSGVLDDIEAWFVERGLPHFVERSTDGSVLDAWTRALPILVGAYLLLGFNALDLANWTLAQNLGAAAVVIVVLIAVWALSNRLRHVPTFDRPTDIDAPELALFVIGPALPGLLFGQPGDALQSVITALVLLALIYLWSSYGIGPLLRWGARRGSRQIASLGSLVARALPLLLLFNTFLFINAEVWEMAGTLDGPAYFIVIFTFVALGAAFALSRVPGTIRSVNEFDRWDDVDQYLAGTPAEPLAPMLPDGTARARFSALRLRQRLNIGLLVVFGQALQITLVTAALTGFFIGFGFLGITESTALGWTQLDDIDVLWTTTLGDRQLVLSEPLVRVSVFLGAFSGMYFTVVLTTDDTYRSEFADEVGPEIREALAVRTAYRVARGTEDATELT